MDSEDNIIAQLNAYKWVQLPDGGIQAIGKDTYRFNSLIPQLHVKYNTESTPGGYKLSFPPESLGALAHKGMKFPGSESLRQIVAVRKQIEKAGYSPDQTDAIIWELGVNKGSMQGGQCVANFKPPSLSTVLQSLGQDSEALQNIVDGYREHLLLIQFPGEGEATPANVRSYIRGQGYTAEETDALIWGLGTNAIHPQFKRIPLEGTLTIYHHEGTVLGSTMERYGNCVAQIMPVLKSGVSL